MEWAALFLAWAGAIVLLVRIGPRLWNPDKHLLEKTLTQWPKVTLVVPARNEEHNIHRVLTSLQNLDYPDFEIFVMDDQSTDNTKQIAEKLGVRVLEGTPPPEGWNGKNWACHQAIQHGTGDIYLFTDADTDHAKDSLKRSVSFFLNANLSMMSALPHHRLDTWWEKLLGPFHTMLFAATAPFSPKPKRLFAIGQYLMFTKDSYARQGGHKAVRNQYPDDLALANACLQAGGQFRIFPGPSLFQVRMYPSFSEFITGWRRNFLAGIQQSNIWATIEVILIFCALTGGGKFYLGPLFLTPMLLSFLIILYRQKTWGHFSFFGVLLMPFSLTLFTWVTLLAVIDYARGNVLRWKGRAYTGWVTRAPSHDS